MSYDGPRTLTDQIINYDGSAYYGGSVEFDYDTDGRRNSQTLKQYGSGSNINVTFGYDDDSLLETAGNQTLTHDSTNGLLTNVDNGNVHVTYTHNSNGDVATYTAKYNTTTIYTYALTYYNDGRIHTMVETIQGATTSYEYFYDVAGRLSSVKKNTVTVSSYTYDNNSNRTSGTKNGVAFTGTYDDQDRLATWNTLSFTYNDNGEMISRTNSSLGLTTNYTYDAYGHLMSANVSGGMDVVYLRDGLGRRIVRNSSSSETHRYIYDGNQRVIGELNADGSIRRMFVYGSKGNVPDYYTDGTEDFQYLTDHLGSVRLVVKVSDGTITLRRDYDEFGIITNTSGADTQPFGFAGGVYDAQTNFLKFGEREYDPEVGRWTSKDPILFGGGDTNLYGYVMADPINFIDSTGLSAADVGRIRGGFNDIVDLMNRSGNRRPGSGLGNGLMNNASSALNTATGGRAGSPFMGCADQAENTIDHLRDLNRNLDDDWTFSLKFSPPLHFSVEGRSSNPRDPVLNIDPWWNSMGR